MFPDQGLKAMIWLGKLISLRTGREKAGQGTDGWTNDDRTKDSFLMFELGFIKNIY